MLADRLTKTMDSSVLRESLRTGKYSLFDEALVLKQRADGRRRLKWIKEQTPSEEQSDPVLTENGQLAMVSEHFESQDFWKVGPGDQVRRIHVQPRTRRFVPIGVAGCPCDLKDLLACRETRVTNGRVEKDFWPGTRGAAPMNTPWTGETIFFRRKERVFMQRIRCVKLPSFLNQVVLGAFSRNDRAILRRISRAGGSGVNGRSGRETVSEGLTFAIYMCK